MIPLAPPVKALSLWQPWASLLTLRPSCLKCNSTGKMGITIQCDYGTGFEEDEVDCDSCPPPIKEIETRSWRAPESLIGQRVAFHAAKHPVDEGLDLAGHTVLHDGLGDPMLVLPEAYEDVGEGALHAIPLPYGRVVGSGRLVECLPMRRDHPQWDHLHVTDTLLIAWRNDDVTLMAWDQENVSDQYPYGLFEHGRYAWLFDYQATIWERCPYCWADETVTCPVCRGAGRLEEPPSVVGRQGVFNWTAPGPDDVAADTLDA